MRWSKSSRIMRRNWGWIMRLLCSKIKKMYWNWRLRRCKICSWNLMISWRRKIRLFKILRSWWQKKIMRSRDHLKNKQPWKPQPNKKPKCVKNTNKKWYPSRTNSNNWNLNMTNWPASLNSFSSQRNRQRFSNWLINCSWVLRNKETRIRN